ncbi:MAG: cryptochrome/photolyase family protein [Acidobacteriota bacterium]
MRSSSPKRPSEPQRAQPSSRPAATPIFRGEAKVEDGKPVFFVGPWDLNAELPCVPQDPAAGSVLLVESIAKGKALPFHRKKLVLVLSALHHFARELANRGYDVTVLRARSYVDGIRQQVEARRGSRVEAMKPREWGLAQALARADREGTLGAPLRLHDDGGAGSHFFLTRQEFAGWAGDAPKLRMDTFYRKMRRDFGVLLDAKGKPEGGRWSFDKENRKPPPDHQPPPVERFPPNQLTRSIMERVEGWAGRWGSAYGFDWPVTRAQALEALDRFLDQRGEGYGPYQDAMLKDQPWMWHSLISPALNLSLISPREVVARALEAWRGGALPLASAEGFIRQVLGWREFLRGVYWRQMPGLREANGLQAQRPLPKLFWDPSATDLECLKQSVGQVLETGYGHHIQRLMVLGNFALLAGIRPLEVSHWFWAGFVDAYEWVELPNVHGMALFADETFTTKPYAASGAYIHRMSDYCGSCRYSVKQRSGEGACPFNHLFWSFIDQHRPLVAANPRMKVLLRTWDRWDSEEQESIRRSSAEFLAGLDEAQTGWSFEDDAC